MPCFFMYPGTKNSAWLLFGAQQVTLKHQSQPPVTDVPQPVVNQGMKLAFFKPTFTFGYFMSLGKGVTVGIHNLTWGGDYSFTGHKQSSGQRS